MRPILLVVVVVTLGCSSGRTQEDCDKIADEIRAAADARGIPRQGACNSGIADFNDACAELRKCQEEVD